MYRKEFPYFPEMPEVADLLARGFRDFAYHNDAMPRFVSADYSLQVWIDHPEDAQREEPGNPRFSLDSGFFDPEDDSEPAQRVYFGDDWAQVLREIDARQG